MPGLLFVSCCIWLAAQEGPAPPPDAEDERSATVVVTGERVERTLLETPSSVAVFTERQIDGLPAADRLDELLTAVPNVAFGSGGEGPTVRGQDTTGVLRDLPAFLGGTRPRLTIQTDGRAAGFNEFVFGAAPLWDVQRVEIFRSPQTTTQGRNSIAGAIFIHTNDPTYDWEARARLLADDAGTLQASGLVSGPLLADQLAFRIAAEVRAGRSSSRLADFLPDIDANDQEYAILRAKLLAEPHILPGLRLEASLTHLETQAPQIEGLRPPFRQRRDPRPGYGVFATDVESLSLQLEYPLSPTLRSTATLAFGESSIRRYARPGLGENAVETRDRSIEALLRWEPRTSVRLMGGFHLGSAELSQSTDLSALIGTGRFEDAQDSLGIFADGTIRPAPRLTVTAGLRYQRDRQDRQGSLGRIGRVVDLDYRETFEAWLPRLSVAYDFSRHVQFGLLLQRAYNPGGTTLDLRTGDGDRFAAESLWAYELFGRASLAGGRLAIVSNIFYNDMRNAQRPQVQAILLPDGSTELASRIGNAPRARSYGMELELRWRPSARFSISGGIGLLDTRILETVERADPLAGREFQRAPEFTASAAVEFHASDRLRLTAQLRHHGGYFSDDANDPLLRIGESTLVDGRLSYRVGRATIFAFARNIFDRFALTYLFNSGLATAADPRELGVGIEARF